MNQYITVKRIYEKGTIRLLEIPDKDLISHSKVMVIIPLRKNKSRKKPSGIPIAKFSDKINLFTNWGDSVKESEIYIMISVLLDTNYFVALLE